MVNGKGHDRWEGRDRTVSDIIGGNHASLLDQLVYLSHFCLIACVTMYEYEYDNVRVVYDSDSYTTV